MDVDSTSTARALRVVASAAFALACSMAALLSSCHTAGPEPENRTGDELPAARTIGDLEPVATFGDAIPAGVAVSDGGRIFVAFPRWDGRPFTLAEIVDGRVRPYPSRTVNRFDRDRPSRTLGSVEALAVAGDALWVLDTGRPDFEPTPPGAAKLVRIGLESDEVDRTIVFPERVLRKWSYLSGVAVDPDRGQSGYAFATDASEVRLNGLIAVNLESGESRRRLDLHPSTRASDDFVPFVEGRPVYFDLEGRPPSHLTLGAHGVALSGDGQRLFYTPLAGRRLYSVSVDALTDRDRPAPEIAETIRSYGDLGFAADGLAAAPDGGLFLSNYEDGAIVRFRPTEPLQTVVRDPRLLWPDAVALHEGHVYVTVTQRHRQSVFNDGRELAEPPYALYRARLPEQ